MPNHLHYKIHKEQQHAHPSSDAFVAREPPTGAHSECGCASGSSSVAKGMSNASTFPATSSCAARMSVYLEPSSVWYCVLIAVSATALRHRHLLDDSFRSERLQLVRRLLPR